MIMDNKTRHEKLLEEFLDRGLKGFKQEEILEMLLGYVVSDNEANRISKKLLSHLGSVTAVMDMRVEGLIRVGDLSEKSATLLNMLPKIIRRYYTDKLDVENMTFDNLENIGAFCTARYIGATDEVLSIILIDEHAKIMGVEVIQVGSFSAASVNFEKIAEILFAYDAPYFILVHNHPDGELQPSDCDIEVTYWVGYYFEFLGSKLLEHIIVYNNRYMPIMRYMDLEDDFFL